jgi:inner membrane protein involved in colicin E2 resistance
MSYKVKKGLERPLTIQGMALHYFYLWCVSVGVSFFIVMGLVMSLSKGHIPFMAACVILAILGAIIMGLKIVFVNKSKHKVKNGYRDITISNMQIMKFLK